MKRTTDSMITLAKAIAARLEVDEPNYEDYNETKEFIDYWRDDFYELSKARLRSEGSINRAYDNSVKKE